MNLPWDKEEEEPCTYEQAVRHLVDGMHNPNREWERELEVAEVRSWFAVLLLARIYRVSVDQVATDVVKEDARRRA
jgi:hypothetical protein